MSLKNKKIKVDGNIYIVKSQSQNTRDDNGRPEEVIVLVRTLENTTEKPGTIYDLGYKSEKDVVFTDDEITEVMNMIDSSINHEVQMASIDRSGLISISTAVLKGLSLQDRNQYKVSFIEQTSTVNPVVKIDLIFLANSILLANQFQQEVSEYNRSKEPSTAYDEIINDSIDSKKDASNSSELPDFIEELLSSVTGQSEKQESNSSREISHELDGFLDMLKKHTQNARANDDTLTRSDKRETEEFFSHILGRGFNGR